MTDESVTFDNYLRSEYDHIAEAHFRTIDTITAFFRYYLLIMSIPISLIAAFITIAKPTDSILATERLVPVLASISLIISLVGFGVLLYLIILRMDAVLYARTVNAIRKHFYDKVPNKVMDIDAKIRKRVLPQTSFQPSYLEWMFFGPVVGVMALLNSFYLFWAVALFGGLNPVNIYWQAIPQYTLPVSVVFFGLHFVAYWFFAHHREHAYLKSYILGVDICGVLNEHRIQFCKILRKNTGREINPDDITVIPVHEHPMLNLKRSDTDKVFNDPEYWIDMEPTSLSPYNLRTMRKAFGLKVILFTHRPWPTMVSMKPREKKQVLDQWNKASSEFYQRGIEQGRIAKARFLRHPRQWILMKIGRTPIERITRNWLEFHGFKYDELIIEKASDDVSDPQVHFVNRFYISRQKRIRFFVEDDLEKAVKLAHICDVVLLYDQPYNQDPKGRELPANIVRVKTWDAVYREIRRLA